MSTMSCYCKIVIFKNECLMQNRYFHDELLVQNRYI